MRRIALFALFAANIPTVFAAAADPQRSALQARRTAIGLFASGQSAAAVAHLRTYLPPEAGPDGATTALVQGLIEITHSFYNQRRLNLAREVVAQAIVAADPVLAGRSAAPAVRRASLVSSLGLLSEEVLLDLRRAEGLYDAAAALEPTNSLHRARKQAVVNKQVPRGGRGGP
ncbi:MAG: hypothetical protein FJ399_04140 [Verrucomicrobia bacterium]|nr:hypothetical protein [Verrucomicrobiota bacterium]